MNDKHPQYPQQPGPGQPQQPGYGYPPPPPAAGQGYPPQPGFGTLPPKKNRAGKIVGFGCLGVVALFVLGGIAVSVGGDDGEDSGRKSDDRAAVAEKSPAAGKDAPKKAEKPAEQQKKKAPQQGPVKVTAKKTSFAKSVLAGSGNYTSVSVTVTNNGDEEIDVNPLYFTITDAKGTKHTCELGSDKNQIDTLKLAPGENVSGTVTGKGLFAADYVTYTDGLIGDSVRADVS